MQRYFAKDKKGQSFILGEDDYYHLKTVMRMKNNDQIEVIYDKKLYLCSIINLQLKKIKIVKEIETKPNNLPQITLIIPLLRESKMSLILEKATELGVNIIIPVVMTRSIIKLDHQSFLKKKQRWERICKEASEQSKRVDIPFITDLMTLEKLKEINGLKLICSTSNNLFSLKKGLKTQDNYDKISIVFGPEGGFEKEEEQLLIKFGFKPVSLGNRILRVETVPIVVLGIINYKYME